MLSGEDGAMVVEERGSDEVVDVAGGSVVAGVSVVEGETDVEG